MKAQGSSFAEEKVMENILDTCVLMRSRLISRMITSIYDEELRPLGIGSAQFVLLGIIYKMQPATRAEIGRFHHQERSTLTRNLKVVLSEGWAEEVEDSANGRRRPLILTQAGRDLLRKAAPAWEAGQAKTTALLGREGVTALMDIANRLMKTQRPV